MIEKREIYALPLYLQYKLKLYYYTIGKIDFMKDQHIYLKAAFRHRLLTWSPIIIDMQSFAVSVAIMNSSINHM